MLKGVIFDMDGTLTLTEGMHYRAFAQVFKKYGIDFGPEEEITEYAGRGSRFTFTDVFQKRGKKVSPEEIEKCMQEKKDLYKKIVQSEGLPLVGGVLEFVKMVHEKGLKKIIATGNSDMSAVRFILEKTGLSEYFPDVLLTSEVANSKPAPDVFLEAAKRLGLKTDECVVFEDSINGVSAARSAGIRCIALETTTKKEDLLKAGASVVVKDYEEVTDEILNENNL